jgi:hypothetical protein
MKTLLAVVITVFCVSLAALAEGISLTPSADTSLFESYPDDNFGGVISLAAGMTAHSNLTRALIKFNLAGQIPTNVVINSARLRLQIVKQPLGPQPSSFSLHRVLRDWGEGNKAFVTLGEPATAGEATWNNRFQFFASWGTPGGTANVDYSSAASSSSPNSDLGTSLFDTTLKMVADVQHWLENPSQNFGWMLVSEREATGSTARRFGSREDTLNVPVLELEYGPPLRIENVTLAGGTFRFSFAVEPLYTYTVQSRTSLSSGNWNVLTNFTETLRSYDALISDTLNPPSGFYRVLKAPCNCE